MENGLTVTIVNTEHFLHLTWRRHFTWPLLVQSKSPGLPLDLKTSCVAPAPVPPGLLPNPGSCPFFSSSWSPQSPFSGSLHLCSSRPEWPLPRLYARAPPPDPPSRGHLPIAQSPVVSVHKISSWPSTVSASNPAWWFSVAFVLTSHTRGFSLARSSPRGMCTLGR